jgi:hypothetical protein
MHIEQQGIFLKARGRRNLGEKFFGKTAGLLAFPSSV